VTQTSFYRNFDLAWEIDPEEARRLQEHLHQTLFLLVVDTASLARRGHGQGDEGGELGGEGLGGEDADLRPRMGGPDEVHFPRHGGFRRIDDDRGGQALGLAPAQGRQGVGGFP